MYEVNGKYTSAKFLHQLKILMLQNKHWQSAITQFSKIAKLE